MYGGVTGFPGGVRDCASLSMQRHPRAVGCGDPVTSKSCEVDLKIRDPNV